jgi:hypothetical protein
MTAPTYEELLAENERLTTLNRGLANQVVNMSDTLQASARQITADAWGKGHEDGFWNGRMSSHATALEAELIGKEHAEANNPYRQPVETFGADA